MSPELIGVLAFVLMLVLIALRVPVAISMIAVSLLGYTLMLGPSVGLARLGSDAFHAVAQQSLSVIPLYVLMGMLLANSGMTGDLFTALNRFLWRLRGGLGVATIGASALFGAVNGSAVAATSTMSVVAFPAMTRQKYDSGFAAATSAVGGTLGALIPPSGALVLYAVLTEESIGAMLIAGVIPGIMTAILLMITAHLIATYRPKLAPQPDGRPLDSIAKSIKLLWPVPVIFGISIGGLYSGWFTPSESGAVGAVLALLYALMTKRLSWGSFQKSMSETLTITAMIFLLVVGGQMFGYFLSITRVPTWLGTILSEADTAPWIVILGICILYFALGTVMDELAILIIMTPIMYPLITGLGYDGIWFGILTTMLLLTGLLTPPVGLLIFVVSGLTNTPLVKVFKHISPYVVTVVIAIALVVTFPEIATWLPDQARQ